MRTYNILKISFLLSALTLLFLYNFEFIEKSIVNLILIFSIIFIIGLIDGFLSSLILKDKSWNLKLKPTLTKRIFSYGALIVLLLSNLLIFTKTNIDDETKVILISLFTYIIFLIIRNIKVTIMLSEHYIGNRNKSKFIKWSKITHLELKKESIELWNPHTALRIKLSQLDVIEQDKLFDILNQKLNENLRDKLLRQK